MGANVSEVQVRREPARRTVVRMALSLVIQLEALIDKAGQGTATGLLPTGNPNRACGPINR